MLKIDSEQIDEKGKQMVGKYLYSEMNHIVKSIRDEVNALHSLISDAIFNMEEDLIEAYVNKIEENLDSLAYITGRELYLKGYQDGLALNNGS